MKIRTGFVSNSSTSSFLIYGASIGEVDTDALIQSLKEQEGFEEAKENFIKKYEEYAEKYSTYNATTFDDMIAETVEQEGIYEFLSWTWPKWSGNEAWEDISIESPPYDNLYVGLDPRDMKDDETLAEFKERAKNAVSVLSSEELKLGWHKMAWRDG